VRNCSAGGENCSGREKIRSGRGENCSGGVEIRLDEKENRSGVETIRSGGRKTAQVERSSTQAM